MSTMGGRYGDGTKCLVCDECGLCISHGDCRADGCGNEVCEPPGKSNQMSKPIFKVKKIRLKGQKLRKVNEKVLERDNWSCQGETCPGGFPLDAPHHIVFKSQGGEDTEENLITLCRYCHSAKHGINVVMDFEPVPF